MAKIPIEVGQSFCKTDSTGIVWTLHSFNENTDPIHGRLVRLDDPTTSITVSVNVLRDPKHFMRRAVEEE